jgi:predicted HAD superfamily Cof-like phosphohydrolase
MNTNDRVREFHTAFNHPVATALTVPDAKTRLLRFKLLLEEVLEYGRAVGIKGLCEQLLEKFETDTRETLDGFAINPLYITDQVAAADALGDIDYVCQGANIVHGFPSEAVAIEIHRANMSKLGEDGKPVHAADGKVVKGPNYRAPDVEGVLVSKVGLLV